MKIDILILIIVVGTMMTGKRRGLIVSLLQMSGWLGGLVVGFICTPIVKTFLMDNTGIYTKIYESVSLKIETIMMPQGFEGAMPAIIEDTYDKALGAVAASAAEAVSSFLMTAFSFALLIIIIKIITGCIMHGLSDKSEIKVGRRIDANLGLCFGFVCGVMAVFVGLALALPVLTMWWPDKIIWFQQELQNSIVAGDLYDNNLVSLMIADLL